jgi:hypothetical protein
VGEKPRNFDGDPDQMCDALVGIDPLRKFGSEFSMTCVDPVAEGCLSSTGNPRIILHVIFARETPLKNQCVAFCAKFLNFGDKVPLQKAQQRRVKMPLTC